MHSDMSVCIIHLLIHLATHAHDVSSYYFVVTMVLIINYCKSCISFPLDERILLPIIIERTLLAEEY